MPRKKKSTSPQILNTPPLNTDVISAICSWLRVRDVKNCRLVSHDWNIAAKPVLKRKSVINLPCSFHQSDAVRNERFQREMASFGQLHHVHIKLSKWSSRPIVKRTNDICPRDAHFFTKYLSPQKLGITGKIFSVLISQFFEQVLLNPSANLVQVELGLHVDDDYIKGDDPLREFCTGKVFPTVKRLDLPFSRENWSLGKVKVPQILAAFPNVEELRVDSDLLPVLFVKGGSSPRFLSKLWVTGCMSGSKCSAILNLTQPLKHLHIEEACDPDEYDWKTVRDVGISASLYAVLFKHRHTLEYLDLGMAKLRAGSETWKFPSFPNLKRLNVMKGFYSHDDHGVSFDSEILNYSETFPKLEELQFTPWNGNWTPYFQSFFPEKLQICVSVTRLDISDEKEHANFIDMFRERHQGKINSRFARILNLFPNADNLFMQELKGYLVKKGHIGLVENSCL